MNLFPRLWRTCDKSRYAEKIIHNWGVECRWGMKQELRYRKQIARQLRAQYVESINSNGFLFAFYSNYGRVFSRL